jgi:hypothetical protein
MAFGESCRLAIAIDSRQNSKGAPYSALLISPHSFRYSGPRVTARSGRFPEAPPAPRQQRCVPAWCRPAVGLELVFLLIRTASCIALLTSRTRRRRSMAVGSPTAKDRHRNREFVTILCCRPRISACTQSHLQLRTPRLVGPACTISRARRRPQGRHFCRIQSKVKTPRGLFALDHNNTSY